MLIQNQFLEAEDLPFQDLLTESMVRELLPSGFRWAGRFYSPLNTRCWCSSGSAFPRDPARRRSPGGWLNVRLTGRKSALPPRAGTVSRGPDCRKPWWKGLARRVGHGLHKRACGAWLWKGRNVKLADGSTVSMPDTRENQQAYPSPATSISQKSDLERVENGCRRESKESGLWQGAKKGTTNFMGLRPEPNVAITPAFFKPQMSQMDADDGVGKMTEEALVGSLYKYLRSSATSAVHSF